MKNILKTFVVVLLIVGCDMATDDRIKQQIADKKARIAKLEQEIIELEKELTDSIEIYNTIAVEIKEMEPETFRHYITVFGNVEANRYAKVSPEMSGMVTRIHVREGQRVRNGQLLVSLNTDATQSSINEAKTGLELATITYERQKSLWDQQIGSEIQYLQAKAQKESAESRLRTLEAQLRMSQVSAPFDGLVDRVYLKVGEMAGPGIPVVELVNLSQITIKADVSETHIGKVYAGENVELAFSSIPDLMLETKINRVSKVINPGSRTFQIELNLNNPNERIRPNMISSIKINDFTTDSAFVVPSVVVKRDITGDYLYVVTENERGLPVATKKYVKRGLTYEGSTLITEGLSKGDMVVVAGYNLVSSGSYVAIQEPAAN